MSTIDISFITINYNSSLYTIELIKSIEQHTSANTTYEIVIVDNASTSDEFTLLETFVKDRAQCTLVRNRINSGFAAGNMLGINYACGAYYFFINNDCKLLNDTGTILKQFCDQNPRVALAGAKIVDENGKYSSSFKQFPHAIKQLFGNSVQRLFSKRKFPSNKTKLDMPTRVEVISGSCMFFRAKDFCDLGGFDTRFFLYCEEEDISKRVWDNNKEVYFVPQAEIFHKGGGSTSQNLLMEKEFYISYAHLRKKHHNTLSRIALSVALFFKLFFRIFKKKNGLTIFLFVLLGSPDTQSLRYKQKVVFL